MFKFLTATKIIEVERDHRFHDLCFAGKCELENMEIYMSEQELIWFDAEIKKTVDDIWTKRLNKLVKLTKNKLRREIFIDINVFQDY